MKRHQTMIATGLLLGGTLAAVSVAPARAADPTPPVVDSTESITPSQSQKTKLPSTYGVVQSVAGNTLVVRLLDGKTETYTLADPAIQSDGFKRGELVGFDPDAQKMVKNLQAPTVERKFEGTVSSINKKNQVTLTAQDGQTLTTYISPSTVARMGIVPGKEIMVTQYANTWATKVCNREVPAPIPQAVEPTPMPVAPPMPTGAGDFPPPPMPTPVKGLW
ncbi:MAG TPA: hypothetical protein V6D19_14770 [Stenomitos sp.]